MSRRIQIPFIIISGFVLRLVALDQSLWLDEAIEWWGVTAFGLRKLLTGYMLGDFNPPGNHLLMWFWVRMFGDSEIAMRMPSVLFGVGTVWMVYKISEFILHNSDLRSTKQNIRNFEPRASSLELAATLLAATNGLLIYYSQEARMYAMATFFVTASVWAFLRLQKKFSILLFTVYCLLFIVALYSHYLTWLMVPVFVVGGMRGMRGVREVGLRGIKYALPLLATAPLWPLLAKQLQNGIASAGNSQWAMLSQTTPKNVALVFVKFVTGRVPFPDELIWQLVVGALVVLFWVGVVRGVREMWGIREHRVIVYWLVVPLVLGGLIGLAVPVFSYFRFLFVLPAAILLFVRGISVRRVRGVRVMEGMGVIGFLSFSLLYLLFQSNHRENWRGAVEVLHHRDDNPFVVIHSAVRPPFDYYDRKRSAVIPSETLSLTFDEKSRFERDITAIDQQGVWYIPYGSQIFDSSDSTLSYLTRIGYKRTFEQHFRSVTLEQWRWMYYP